MTRKRILSNWIDLPGFDAVDAFTSELWAMADPQPLAAGSLPASTSIVGPGTLALSSVSRIFAPTPPTIVPTSHFTHAREHTLRIASSIFSARPLRG